MFFETLSGAVSTLGSRYEASREVILRHVIVHTTLVEQGSVVVCCGWWLRILCGLRRPLPHLILRFTCSDPSLLIGALLGRG